VKMDKVTKVLLFRNTENNKNKKDTIGWACGMDGRSDKCLQNFNCITVREGATRRLSNHVFV